MKKVSIFIHSDWAFGSIHFELAKNLYLYNIDCRLIPWEKKYTVSEIQEIDTCTDIWLTNPHGYVGLKNDFFLTNVAKKCVVVLHSLEDINHLKNNCTQEEIYLLKKYGAVSSWLKEKSFEKGIYRIPDTILLGINYNTFFGESSKAPQVIGYSSLFRTKESFSNPPKPEELGVFNKRSWLISEIAKNTGLELKIANTYHNSYSTMPGYYRFIDILVCPSLEEGACLPILEAGAAGRLVLSTPIGHWADTVTEKGSIQLPLNNEEDIVNSAVSYIDYYKNHQKEYIDKCRSIQQHATDYDWRNKINRWLELLN